MRNTDVVLAASIGNGQLLEVIAQVTRLTTAVFLLAVSVYFQFCLRPENDVPVQYRWPPFFLSVLVFDRTRYGSIVPFHDSVLAIAIYISFLYLMWHGFLLVCRTYSLYPPRKRLGEVMLAKWQWLRELRD